MPIFDRFLSTEAAALAFDDASFVAAMLRFESALARAQAATGLIPASAAEAVAAACANADAFDIPTLVASSAHAGSVAIPLVRQLTARVREADPDAARFVHFGSTSQDAIDTAAALVTQPVVQALLHDAEAIVAALLLLAERHADTPLLARTLGQPASITSFGWKAAQWAAPVQRGLERVRAAAADALAVQLGGAVGTQAHMQGKGAAVVARMAADLQLAAPEAPWHTQRDAWVALGCALGLLVGSLGKIATDIVLMGQFEVGEVGEPAEAGRGGSSAMPHKRNPVASMVVLSAAHRVPHHVAALLAAMPQAHERALGAWQAELAEWPHLLMAAHGAVQALAAALPGLQVHVGRMRANIDKVRAALPAESAAAWFDPALAVQASGLAREQVARLRADVMRAAVFADGVSLDAIVAPEGGIPSQEMPE